MQDGAHHFTLCRRRYWELSLFLRLLFSLMESY
jgi:hypothetical protein